MRQTIASLLKGRENNFNLLRLIAASMVIVSHSWPLRFSPSTSQPLDPYLFVFFGNRLRFTLGILAVQVFFVISGFLVTQSFVRRPHAFEFLKARVLRIMPALLAVNGFCVFVLGLYFTSLSWKAYLAERGVWQFLSANTLFYKIAYTLPGVFGTNSFPGLVNGSLWSLPIEVCCYALVLAFGLLGFYRRTIFVVLFLLTASLMLFLSLHYAEGFAALLGKVFLPAEYVRFLGLSFVLGQVLFLFRQWIPMNWTGILLALAACVASLCFTWTSIGFNVSLAYLVIGLALVPAGVVRKFNLLPDISYGMYLYGFPIQQSLMALVPGMSHRVFIVTSWSLVALLAWVSWTIIEEPALRLVRKREPERPLVLG